VKIFLKPVLLFFFFYYLLIGFIYFANSPPKGDEVHYLLTTESIINYRTLAVGESYNRLAYNIWYKTLDRHSVKGQNGQEFIYHGLGLFPVILVPGYLLFGRYGAMLTVIIFAIGSLHFMANIIKKITDSDFATLITIFLVGISVPFSEYAFLIFPEMVGLFILSAITWFMLQNKKMLTTTILIGVLPWIHIRFLSLAILFCFFFFFRLKEKKDRHLIFLSFVIIFMYFIFLKLIYGSFDPRYPYILAHVNTSAANPILNIINVIVDGQYGILWYSPFIIFLIPGVLLYLKNNSKNIFVLIIPTLCYFGATFSYYDWNGGYSPPGRYFLITLPLLLPFIAYFLKRVSTKIIMFLTLALGSWSVLLFFLNFTKISDYGFIFFDGYVIFAHQISKYINYDIIRFIPHFYPTQSLSELHFMYMGIFIFIGAALYIMLTYHNAKK